MPGPRQFLKKPIKPKMLSDTCASLVRDLVAIYQRLNESHDKKEMAKLIAILATITDGSSPVFVVAETQRTTEVHVREIIDDFMPKLLEKLYQDSYSKYEELSRIDWKKLFNILPEPIVELVINPPSDELFLRRLPMNKTEKINRMW